MGRISRSFELAKASWRVLKADKELLLLPVISGVASIIVAASFVLPLFAAGGLDDEGVSTGATVTLFVMYVALAYVTIFFNAALVSAAHERLSGGDPTLGSALRGAASRAGKILPWVLVSATVSIILRALEERAGFVGRIVIGFIGMAWTVVTFLVLPIIVIEGAGVRDALSKSGNLFRETWGENLAAQVGFSIIGFVASIPAIVLMFLGVSGGGGFVVVAILISVLWLILVAVVLSALSGIFQTALYHYAVDGQVPSGYFETALMSGAFGPRRGGGRGIIG